MEKITSFENFTHRLKNRVYLMGAHLIFSAKAMLLGGQCWVRGGPVVFPFTRDGDLQALNYSQSGDEWWENEKKLVGGYIPAGAVVIDVGANIGFLSALFSSLVGQGGQVYSFEPSPEVYAKLRKVLEKNQLTNVSAVQAGCGSRAGKLTLYSPEFSGNATLRPLGAEGQKKESYLADAAEVPAEFHTHEVEILRLDEYFGAADGEKKSAHPLKRLDFVKIDTEGFEDEVLAGMEGLLRKFRPVIYIELCAQFKKSSERAVEVLTGLGYRFEPEVDLVTSRNGDNYLAIWDGSESAAGASR